MPAETAKPLPPPPKAGDLVTIKYLNNQQEHLRLRELSNSELEKFSRMLVAEDTPGFIGLCLERPLAWVDSLSRDCYNELAKTLINQNFSATMEMALHNPIVGLRVGPLLRQMQTLFELRRLMSSAPTSPPKPEDGSEQQSSPALKGSAEPTGTQSTATAPAASGAS
jgi:hypothetical protein